MLFAESMWLLTCCKGVSGAMCCEKNLRLFAGGQRCQHKVSFDRPQPEQSKWNEVKSFEFYPCFFCICGSFYFFSFLFNYRYFFFLVNKCFLMILNTFFDFWTNQTMLKLIYCNLRHHWSCWYVREMCVKDGVFNNVVCERDVCERWCVTKLCVKYVCGRCVWKMVCVWQSCVKDVCERDVKVVCESCVWDRCVCVWGRCVTKLCVTKLCCKDVWERCVWKLCVCNIGTDVKLLLYIFLNIYCNTSPGPV